jgi:hypothetical protein
MTTPKNPAADTPVSTAWRKWQRAIEKYANPLIKPSTAKRYYRDARKARLEYNAALKGDPIETKRVL